MNTLTGSNGIQIEERRPGAWGVTFLAGLPHLLMGLLIGLGKLSVVACALLILLLAAWPRTRRLAQNISQDWTLFSFLLYGGVIFTLELVFEEYRYAELWKIAGWASLALGAWIYLKSETPRKRILALLGGVTLTYWIAAVGKWIILPLQSWGAWYGYDHWTYLRFEFGSTIAHWGWVVFFMLIPALLTLIPRSQEIVPIRGDEPVEERPNPA